MDVSLQNMQSCFLVYQVFLQPRVMQIKACKTSRLQILPQVRFPRSTVIIPITKVSANIIFRSGCCPSICVCLPRVWKVFVAVKRLLLLAWWVMLWQSDSPAQSLCVAYFSYNHYLWNRSFFSPFSSFISAQHSLITWLLGMFQTKSVQSGAKPGVAGAEQMQTVHCAVTSLEGSFKRLRCADQDLLFPFLEATKPKHKV